MSKHRHSISGRPSFLVPRFPLLGLPEKTRNKKRETRNAGHPAPPPPPPLAPPPAPPPEETPELELMEVLIDFTILPRPVGVPDPDPWTATNQGTTVVWPPCKSERRSSSLLRPRAVAATTTRSTLPQSKESTRVARARLRMKLFRFFQARYHFCPVAVRLLSVAVKAACRPPPTIAGTPAGLPLITQTIPPAAASRSPDIRFMAITPLGQSS